MILNKVAIDNHFDEALVWLCSHAPIESVCGFDLSAFQKLADAGNGRHGGIFPYTMSEYEYHELTHPMPVATFDFTGLVHDVVYLGCFVLFRCQGNHQIYSIES